MLHFAQINTVETVHDRMVVVHISLLMQSVAITTKL